MLHPASLRRGLYVGVIGNEEELEILPITEMVFDQRKTRPEERTMEYGDFTQRIVDAAVARYEPS